MRGFVEEGSPPIKFVRGLLASGCLFDKVFFYVENVEEDCEARRIF